MQARTSHTCYFFMTSSCAPSSQVLPWVPVLIFLNDRLQNVRGNTFSLPKLLLIVVFYNSKKDSNKYRNLYQECDFGMTVLIIVLEDWGRTLKVWAREVIAYWLRRNQYNEGNMVWEVFPWDQCTEALVQRTMMCICDGSWQCMVLSGIASFEGMKSSWRSVEAWYLRVTEGAMATMLTKLQSKPQDWRWYVKKSHGTGRRVRSLKSAQKRPLMMVLI